VRIAKTQGNLFYDLLKFFLRDLRKGSKEGKRWTGRDIERKDSLGLLGKQKGEQKGELGDRRLQLPVVPEIVCMM
jgi:hypothetical protein